MRQPFKSGKGKKCLIKENVNIKIEKEFEIFIFKPEENLKIKNGSKPCHCRINRALKLVH